MRAIAIDFETANESRSSACAVGIAWIEGLNIVRVEERLIRPRDMRFSPYSTRIHGIGPEHVRNSPDFPEVWNEFSDSFPGAVVVAHNISFDASVLRSSLVEYGLQVPEFTELCTVGAARLVWSGLTDFRLSTVARHLNLDLAHHRAGSDAKVAGMIAIMAAAERGLSDVSGLISLLDGSARAAIATGAKRTYGLKVSRITANIVAPGLGVLSGMRIVFTGEMVAMTRAEAAQAAANAGAICQDRVRRDTDYLVVGRIETSGKIKKAQSDFERHGRPVIIAEAAFREMLGLKASM
ncbi:MAG: exonuclease domain-containing protein [Inquilinus sp.]|uniref:exonuclease domain-containing protein n=1 Tax=Inquilinus sp. TaxID=1932117 RepID=UPI003F33C122